MIIIKLETICFLYTYSVQQACKACCLNYSISCKTQKQVKKVAIFMPVQFPKYLTLAKNSEPALWQDAPKLFCPKLFSITPEH